MCNKLIYILHNGATATKKQQQHNIKNEQHNSVNLEGNKNMNTTKERGKIEAEALTHIAIRVMNTRR